MKIERKKKSILLFCYWTQEQRELTHAGQQPT